jgi:hypothetical protein
MAQRRDRARIQEKIEFLSTLHRPLEEWIYNADSFCAHTYNDFVSVRAHNTNVRPW